jgi:GNAT superfamily N-acetyltransferase
MVDLAQDLVLDAVSPSDEAALRRWFGLVRDARTHDHPEDPPPCPVEHRGRLSAPAPGLDTTVWLATAADEVVGAAELALPTLDNLDNAMADVLVAPHRRRRGVGTRLLARLADAARAAGRLRLIVEAPEPLDTPGPGAPFLAAAGARMALADRRRRLPLPPVDQAELDRLHDAARAAAGYDLVQWTGDTPARWLDDVAALVGRMATDAPLDDLHYGPEHYDAQRIRNRDAMWRARGTRSITTTARGPDGRLVAYTVILCTATVHTHAHQGDTIVAPEHRGHRLGLLVKLANLRLLRAQHPAVRNVDTYNADSNPYMVSVNEAMGFRPLDRLGEWELDL